MEKARRLVRESDYARVHSQGRSWAHPLLVLRALPNGSETTRFGFSVGKRIGKAVVRNRVKRLLREVVRPISVKPGWDVVIIARSPSAEARFAELRTTVLELLRRAKLLASGSPTEEQ